MDQDLHNIVIDSCNAEGNVTKKTYERAKKIIPGGTQLFGKRPETMAPNQWPAYYSRATGCEVWDLDGQHYFDMATNAIGTCLLGFCDTDVNLAVKNRIDMGSMSTLNPVEEVELAEMLCSIHPWAEQVRFTRTGGETAAVAVRIARATTDRSVVAVCGYHGWHDWYLAANLGESDALRGHLLPGLEPCGVPRELRNTAIVFNYNNINEFQKIIDEQGMNLAAVIMEPCRYKDPEPGFLEYVKAQTHKCGAILIFDEITIGWRLTYGGAHLKLGVTPDIAFFAKAMGNGFPIGAVIGTKEAMEGAHTSFISSTYWTESIGPAAALATLKKLKELNVNEHIKYIGEQVINNWKKYADVHKVPVEFEDVYPCLAHFRFRHEKRMEMCTFYTQIMLEKGFLAGETIYPTLAHNEKIVKKYSEAVDEAFSKISSALKNDNIDEQLKGPVAQAGFKRLL